jgi:hypothetical protein
MTDRTFNVCLTIAAVGAFAFMIGRWSVDANPAHAVSPASTANTYAAIQANFRNGVMPALINPAALIEQWREQNPVEWQAVEAQLRNPAAAALPTTTPLGRLLVSVVQMYGYAYGGKVAP